jgi:hypothetical protein
MREFNAPQVALAAVGHDRCHDSTSPPAGTPAFDPQVRRQLVGHIKPQRLLASHEPFQRLPLDARVPPYGV